MDYAEGFDGLAIARLEGRGLRMVKVAGKGLYMTM